jgi:hypothetical protein
MSCKAKDLKRGDIFRLHVYCQVIAIEPVAYGKRIRVTLALEHQGARSQRGALTGSNSGELEFMDDGCVLKFVCKPSRNFQVYADYGGDGYDDEPETLLPPDDEIKEFA